jgi:hypothetical protein
MSKSIICFLFVTMLMAMAASQQRCARRRIKEERTAVMLGETNITIVKWSVGGGDNGLAFANLHSNENTSVLAAKTYLLGQSNNGDGGYIVYFDKALNSGGWPTRQLYFQLDNVHYNIDPNRMFTEAGIRRSLQPRFNQEAADAVLAFSQRFLQVYGFDRVSVVLTLHNNGPTYSIDEYLPGGVYADDAQRVHVSSDSFWIPRDFYLLSDTGATRRLYALLADECDMNVVLQAASNGTLDDDGSLSVYCAQQHPPRPYVNTEAAAAQSWQGQRVVAQNLLLSVLSDSLSST